jgi:type II secretory pathway pseudopilin PulG
MSCPHGRRERRGFALPAAIMALVVLSALVAGAMFVATGELRAGRTDLADQRALALAELALERTIATWDRRRNTALAVGASEVVVDSGSAEGDRVKVVATRVQPRSFLVTAHAASSADGRGIPTRHTIAASLRLAGAAVPVSAALTATGVVTVVGGVVDGGDVGADGNSRGLCDDAGVAGGAGIAVLDTSLVCDATCSGAPPVGVVGSPPVAALPGLTSDSVAAVIGLDPIPAFAARASIDLAGGTLVPRPVANAGECDRTDALNWGDPSGAAPCGDHYPLVHVRGSAVLGTGSVGQGILLVDGSLRVEAGARFAGVVIAADDIAVIGVGAEIVGAAFALDADRAGGSRVAEGGAVRRRACVVRRAVLGTSRLRRTPLRWWAELR